MPEEEPQQPDRTVPDTRSFLASSPRELRPRSTNLLAAKALLVAIVVIVIVLALVTWSG